MKNLPRERTLAGIVSLIVALSALSIFSDNAIAATNTTELGDFTLDYDEAASVIYNLTYSNDNYTVKAADSIQTEGKNSPIAQLGHSEYNQTLVLDNVTLFSSGDSDMMLLSTTNATASQIPVITVNLPSVANAVTPTPLQKSALMGMIGSIFSAFANNTVYRMAVTGGYVYYMSNSPSVLAGDGTSIVFQNTSFDPGSSMLVGITPSGSIKHSLDQQIGQYDLGLDPLTYDPETGDVTGTYLALNYDSDTGVISNYTNVYTGTTVFTSIYSVGDGNFSGSLVVPQFPEPTAIIVGNVFYFGNNTSVYQIYNNIATLGKFYLSNGTTVMVVDPSLAVSVYDQPSGSASYHYAYGSNFDNFSSLYLGQQYMIDAAPTIITIHNDTFRGDLLVHEGTASISGNTITTTEQSFVQFVAQNLYLHTQLQLRTQLQYALEHGKLGAVISIGPNGPTGNNMTTYYHNALQLTIQNAYTNKVQIQLESQTQQGDNIAMFIPDSIIKNTNQFTLRLDNQVMTKLQDMNSVTNSTSTDQGQYYLTGVDGGTLIVVHIPHFSTHTLEITASEPAESQPFDYTPYIIGAAVGGVVIVVVVALIYRKYKSE